MPRQALPGGLRVDGSFFRGTEMAIPVYALHHQEHYCPDAFTFKPAGWRVRPPGANLAEAFRLLNLPFVLLALGLGDTQAKHWRAQRCPLFLQN